MNKQERDDLLVGILETVSTIALVGASSKPDRPSYQVMKFLLEQRYKVITVNPGSSGEKNLGETIYASPDNIPRNYKMVQLYRASDAAGTITSYDTRLEDAQ